MNAPAARGRAASRLLLAAFMVGAGILHLVAPRIYEPLIPGFLGSPRAWVYGSGVAEIAAGGLLAVPRTRRIGAWAVVAVLVGVFPGNAKMALDGGVPGASGVFGDPVVAWLRLPLQLPLIWWAYVHTRLGALDEG